MIKINVRKKILINATFQYAILLKIAILGISIATIFYFANIYFFKQMYNEAVAAGLPPDNIFFKYLSNQKSFMNKVFLASALMTTVTIFWAGLYLSHRIAGPLYRLTKHLNQFNVSNVEPIRFRKGDYFPEIQEAFNNFIKRK